MEPFLTTYTPAENYLLLHGEKGDLAEVLTITFLDLLLKEVFDTEVESVQFHHTDPKILHTYIKAGKEFDNYTPLPHEKIFMQPFIDEEGVKILRRSVAHILIKKTKTYNGFVKNKLLKSIRLKSFFDNGLLPSLLGKVKFLQAGIEASQQLKREIIDLEQEVDLPTSSHYTVGINKMMLLFGNIYNCPGLGFEILRDFRVELKSELEHEYYNDN